MENEGFQDSNSGSDANENKNRAGLENSKMSSGWLKWCLFGFGGVALAIGFIVAGFWRITYHSVLTSKLKLDNGTQAYGNWINSTVPIYMRIYLFNWTNPEASYAQTEKPSFVEVGPYVFRLKQKKYNLQWNNNNNTITFRNRRHYDFIPELSNGSLTDQITTLNVIPVSLASQVKNQPSVVKFVINTLLQFNERTLHVTKSAEELMFLGYKDKLLDIAKKLKKRIKALEKLPEKFGWYYGKNETVDVYNMDTGSSNINDLGNLYSWNYTRTCGTFTGHCDEVFGSTGDLWPLNISSQPSASLFISDLCSAFTLESAAVETIGGLDGVRFEGTAQMFANATDGAGCYCAPGTCRFDSGVRNVTNCLFAPAFISYPHFYLADESFRRQINGMRPDKAKHKFSITLQKDSGIPVDIQARLQINILVEPIDGIPFVSKLPRTFFPGIWFEEMVRLPEPLMDQMRLTFNIIPDVFSYGALLLVIIGAVVLVVGVVYVRSDYIRPIPYNIERL